MVVGAHETASKSLPLSAVIGVQVGETAAGSVDVTALPFWSTATQSGAEVHEMAVSTLVPLTSRGLLQVDPPFVDFSTFPPLSAATHSEVEGHASAKIPWPLMLTGVLQAAEPPVGFVDLSALPSPSTATQSDADGQETASRKLLLESMFVAVHVEGPPVGSVDVSTFPD